MAKMVYCATPSRLVHRTREIMDYVSSHGHGPLHPLHAFEFERFEGGPVGRERTMEFCCRALEVCDEFWLFGISSGTMTELRYALDYNKQNPSRQKQVRFLYEQFDPEWQKFYGEHKMLIAEARQVSHE